MCAIPHEAGKGQQRCLGCLLDNLAYECLIACHLGRSEALTLSVNNSRKGEQLHQVRQSTSFWSHVYVCCVACCCPTGTDAGG